MKPFYHVFLSFALLGIIHSANAAPKKPEPCGNVVTLNGSVTVKTKQLQAGAPIFPNDEVLTGENSAAKFLMVDKSIIDLGASTSFKFEDYRDGENESRQAELSLEFGSVRASVTKKLDEKSKFHIRTKSSVLAVRGTEFLAKYETKDGKVTEQVTVGSGRVEMNTGGRMVALNPGNQYNATGTIPNKEQSGSGNASSGSGGTSQEEKPALKGEVTTLAPEKLTETLKEAKVEDKTFVETVTFEKRSTKDTKKKEEKATEEVKEKSASNTDTVASNKKEETKEKTKAETAEKSEKNEKVEKTEKAETKAKTEKQEAVAEKRKEETPTTTAAKMTAEKTDTNGTLGAVFQGVTGERLDGKTVIIAKAPDAANIPTTAAPILSKETDRKPATVTDVDKADPKGEGPVLPPNFYDPNRPTTNIPGSITGNGTTPPAATTAPSQVTQTINITVKVDGI